MATVNRRVALVLRGPMGVGKSTVLNELRQRRRSVAGVVLDTGWEINGARYLPTASRYHDLRGHACDVLVVEIGCGEPFDLSIPGASRGAAEWYNVLVSEGREVHVFRLWADWPTIRRNMVGGRPAELLWARLWHCAHQQEIDIVSLPEVLRQLEH